MQHWGYHRRFLYVLLIIVTIVVLRNNGYMEYVFLGNVYLHYNNSSDQAAREIHIVTGYPLMDESPWSDNQWTTNVSQLSERQREVEDVLQKNIDHPLVTKVHLIINQEAAGKRLRGLPLGVNKHKIIVKRTHTMPKYRDFFSYINDNLLNRLVMVMNMDVYLDEGFEKINKTLLVEENICYALTRHGRKEKRCDMSARGNGYCGKGYSGAHDAYVFIFTKPFTESVLAEFDYEMHLLGGENVLLWILKNSLGMRLLNPCKYLKVYHVHCIPIRGKSVRINWKMGKSVSVRETGLY